MTQFLGITVTTQDVDALNRQLAAAQARIAELEQQRLTVMPLVQNGGRAGINSVFHGVKDVPVTGADSSRVLRFETVTTPFDVELEPGTGRITASDPWGRVAPVTVRLSTVKTADGHQAYLASPALKDLERFRRDVLSSRDENAINTGEGVLFVDANNNGIDDREEAQARA